jgi:hypothetical protein
MWTAPAGSCRKNLHSFPIAGPSKRDAYVLTPGAVGIAQHETKKEAPLMSRMESIDTGTVVGDDVEEDADIALWNRMGRAAMFFCIWSAMAIPVLLIIAVR